jgi:hypothetical protein
MPKTLEVAENLAPAKGNGFSVDRDRVPELFEEAL